MKPLDERTEMVSLDDQASFLKMFSLAAQSLRLSRYSLYQMSQEFLADFPPDPSNIKIVYVDWNLPGSEKVGGELIQEIRKISPEVLIYVLSTSIDDDERKEAEEAGANGWIHKANLFKNLKKFNVEYESKIGTFYVWE